MGNTPSNHSELSDCEEDPTEATLIYETKQINKTETPEASKGKPEDLLKQNERRKQESKTDQNKPRSICWNEIDVEYFQKYQAEFELGPKCRHLTFHDFCSDCEIYADFIQKKDHFCEKCIPAAKTVQAALKEPAKE